MATNKDTTEAFEHLEREFQEVLDELLGDSSLEHFSTQYEKLHRALKRSHENEKRLIKKCRELNTEIVNNAVKVQTALKLSREDQSKISALRKEIERGWRMVETSHEKEQRATNTIQNLQQEADKLQQLVEQGAGKSRNQENNVHTLMQQKMDITKQRDMLQGQVQQLQQQKVAFGERLQRLELEKDSQKTEMERLSTDLKTKREEVIAVVNKKDETQEELVEMRNVLEGRGEEVTFREQELKGQEDKLRELNKVLKSEVTSVEAGYDVQGKTEDDISKFKKLQQEERKLKDKLEEERDDFLADLKAKKVETDHYAKELRGVNGEIAALDQARAEQDQKRKKGEKNIAKLRVELSDMQKTGQALTKQADTDSKALMDLVRERDLLTKALTSNDENVKKQIELVGQHEWKAGQLEKEVLQQKLVLQNTLNRVHELDRAKQKATSELLQAHSKYNHGVEVVKKKEAQVGNMQTDIADTRSKLQQQKALYESVRADRNLYSKNLVDSLNEMNQMRDRFKMMYHQIDRLKEEIRDSNQQLIKTHCDHHKVSKEMEKTKDQLEKTKKRQQQLTSITEMQRKEIKKIEITVADAGLETLTQKKELGAIQQQRDILATQLIKRNSELNLVFEKIKIQQSLLVKGESHFRKQWSQKTRAENTLMYKTHQTKDVSYDDNLKKELTLLERELLQERHKVKALSEELENPINVHRWRKLEGSDPQVFQLINKIKTLQNRIITKTEKVAQRDAAIQEKERAYLDLKKVLARQPGPEINESLELYKEHVTTKKQQCVKMTTELEAYNLKVQGLRDELQRLHKIHQDVRKKYYEQQRRDRAGSASINNSAPRPIPTKASTLPRFTGGGFNLSL